MKLFSNISNMINEKRTKKAAERAKQYSERMEYLLSEKTPSDIMEAFRNLKATLSVSMPKKEGGTVLMMTSAYPKDGKTTVTVNLAMMFALSNAKVVLVDADIRKGRIARYFKHKSTPGLADYLSGQASFDEVIHKSPVNENLSYIACGTHSPKPYELLESEQMKLLIEQLKTQYDYVIIDTPPVLLLSDALAVAPLTDGTVLVCRHQVSYVSDVARALHTLTFAKVNVLGAVVNDYKTNSISHSYYGGYKHYLYYSKSYLEPEFPDEASAEAATSDATATATTTESAE